MATGSYSPQRTYRQRWRPVALRCRHDGAPSLAEHPGGLTKPPLDSPERPARLLHPASGVSSFTEPELLSIAEGLAVSARGWPGMKRPTRRTWDLMVASDAFEAWVIAWPPNGAIEPHDHGGSSGAVVVASGELVETTVSQGPEGSVVTETKVLPAGATLTFGAHHVHDVVNLGDRPAISVHVYAPRLTSMTYFEITDGRLATGQTVSYRAREVVP